MQDITPRELKCIRYLTNEMSKEDRSVFEIELSIDNELKALYLEYLNIWKAYPANDLELHHEMIQQKIEGKIKQKPWVLRGLQRFGRILRFIWHWSGPNPTDWCRVMAQRTD